MPSMYLAPQFPHRNDLHLTSSGIGLRYRPLMHQPEYMLRVHMEKPLPPKLKEPDMMIRSNMHPTTSRIDYDEKFASENYRFPVYEKASELHKINYIRDLNEKFGGGGWRKPLTMKNSLSENQDKFCNEEGVKYQYAFNDIFKKRPFFHNEHLKTNSICRDNPICLYEKSHRYDYNPRDKDVFFLNNTNATTYQTSHHSFKPDDLKAYGEHNMAVYPHYLSCAMTPAEECSLRLMNKGLPMHDYTMFSKPAIIPRLSQYFTPVPHKGLQTEYNEGYQRPTDAKQKYRFHSSESTPWVLPKKASPSVLTAPIFYNTEHKNIGSEIPISV